MDTYQLASIQEGLNDEFTNWSQDEAPDIELLFFLTAEINTRGLEVYEANGSIMVNNEAYAVDSMRTFSSEFRGLKSLCHIGESIQKWVVDELTGGKRPAVMVMNIGELAIISRVDNRMKCICDPWTGLYFDLTDDGLVQIKVLLVKQKVNQVHRVLAYVP